MRETAAHHDERCLWHSTSEAVLFLLVGGWLQPLASAGHPESPESKRRFKALLDVSGLTEQLAVRCAPAMTDDDLLRVHGARYRRRFKELSARRVTGSARKRCSRKGASRSRRSRPDWRSGLCSMCSRAPIATPTRSPGRPVTMPCRTRAWVCVCCPTSRSRSSPRRPSAVRVAWSCCTEWSHHGNGTQTAFYNRDDVLTISLHPENCFATRSGTFGERGHGMGEGCNITRKVRRGPVTCTQCGGRMPPVQPTGRIPIYCSGRCRKTAYEARRLRKPDAKTGCWSCLADMIDRLKARAAMHAATGHPRHCRVAVKWRSRWGSARTSMTVSASFVGRTGTWARSAPCRWTT